MPDVPRRTRSGGTELSRRKFARRQWATRWLRLRIVVVGAGLLLATLAALWAVFFSSLFAVDGVTVEGTRMLSTEQVERRSEEHTTELQSLITILYVVFCFKKIKLYHK